MQFHAPLLTFQMVKWQCAAILNRIVRKKAMLMNGAVEMNFIAPLINSERTIKMGFCAQQICTSLGNGMFLNL